MIGIDRLLIFVLLGALLYVLYKYQQSTLSDKNDQKDQKEEKSLGGKKDIPKNKKVLSLTLDKNSNKKKNNEKNKKTLKPKKISIDNISQASVNSTETENEIYKQDSIVDSLNNSSGDADSAVSIGFLDEKSEKTEPDNYSFLSLNSKCNDSNDNNDDDSVFF